jgi:hypothetical protein
MPGAGQIPGGSSACYFPQPLVWTPTFFGSTSAKGCIDCGFSMVPHPSPSKGSFPNTLLRCKANNKRREAFLKPPSWGVESNCRIALVNGLPLSLGLKGLKPIEQALQGLLEFLF